MDTVEVGGGYTIRTTWSGDPTTLSLSLIAPSGSVVVAAKGAFTPSDAGLTQSYTFVATEQGAYRWTVVGLVGVVHSTETGLVIAGPADQPPGPCENWATWAQVEALCPTVDFSAMSQAQRDQNLAVATWILYSLDGRRYPGLCTATRRICRTCTSCGGYWSYSFTNPSTCCCTPRHTIDLGSRMPVWAVWDVKIAGAILDPAAYQLRDRRYLDRIDGNPWPDCSDLTDPDDFTITWVYGRRAPVGLSRAAAMFTAEISKVCIGVDCELPARITNVTREGMTWTILDSQKFIDDGRTGIYLVDLALTAAKIGRKPRPGGFAPYGASTRSARVE